MEVKLMGDITQLADKAGDKIAPAKEDGNLATIKDDIALIKADIDDIRLKQNQQDTHWQNYLTASGVIKTEESGKVVVLTDVVVSFEADQSHLTLQKGGAAGSVIMVIRGQAYTTKTLSFREGLEGDGWDGSNAGDLYFTEGGIAYATFTGYMRDA